MNEAQISSIPGCETLSGGNDAKIIRSHAHNVTGVELSAAPQFRLTIDGHLTAGDQGLGVRSPRAAPASLSSWPRRIMSLAIRIDCATRKALQVRSGASTQMLLPIAAGAQVLAAISSSVAEPAAAEAQPGPFSSFPKRCLGTACPVITTAIGWCRTGSAGTQCRSRAWRRAVRVVPRCRARADVGAFPAGTRSRSRRDILGTGATAGARMGRVGDDCLRVRETRRPKRQDLR